jgi:hypothetical protein
MTPELEAIADAFDANLVEGIAVVLESVSGQNFLFSKMRRRHCHRYPTPRPPAVAAAPPPPGRRRCPLPRRCRRQRERGSVAMVYVGKIAVGSAFTNHPS